MAKKDDATFTTSAKILGVKLKPNMSSYNDAGGNKIEIAFEIEMPRPAHVQTRAAWEKDTSYGEGMRDELKDRKRKLAALEKSGGKRTVTTGRGKNAETVEEEVDLPSVRRELEADIAAAYQRYLAGATRRNERAAAAANHAGLIMALGGQQVRISIAPQQAAMPGMLALPMPEELPEYDEDYADDGEDE